MNLTTTADPTRAQDFATWVETNAPNMYCSPSMFRPAGGMQWYLDHEYTLYLADDDDLTVQGYALVHTDGQIKWLLARDDNALREFARLLIPAVIQQCGQCYGNIENARTRHIVASSRGTITQEGVTLRDTTL